jgi:hypothetical protein
MVRDLDTFGGLETWCERGELNPYPLRDWILSPARLPIPPLSQGVTFNEQH